MGKKTRKRSKASIQKMLETREARKFLKMVDAQTHKTVLDEEESELNYHRQREKELAHILDVTKEEAYQYRIRIARLETTVEELSRMLNSKK